LNKPSVFVTRKIPQAALEKLSQHALVEVWPEESAPPYDVLLEKASQVDGLLTLLTDRIDARLIEAAAPRLKVISQYAVGFDNIDARAATQNGIPVGNTPGVLTETTADFTWALLMAAARRVVEADKEVRAGVWRPWGPDVLTGYDVFGATIGIIGFGRIGQSVARRANGFNMRILYHDPNCGEAAGAELNAACVSLDELLAQSDFVTLHVYLSDATYHMIDRAALQKMKSTAVLVNTARGGVVDPDALVWALKEGIIAAAALDVTEPEPIPGDHPLLALQNLVIAPHIASASKATRERMAQIAVENIIAGIEGAALPHCANPEVYNSR
jgi:glyoxylate reductase